MGARAQVLIDVVHAVEKAVACEGPLEVTDVCRAAEQMEFLKLRTLREYERNEQWRADGYLSAAAGLRATCNMSHGTAAGALKLAQRLVEHCPRPRPRSRRATSLATTRPRSPTHARSSGSTRCARWSRSSSCSPAG